MPGDKGVLLGRPGSGPVEGNLLKELFVLFSVYSIAFSSHIGAVHAGFV